MFQPVHRYDQMNPAARRFARVPRYGRLLSGLSAKELSSITNEAQLFFTVYTKIEENADVATGILHDGLRRPGFEKFGWHMEGYPAQGQVYMQWRVRLALDMLGAIAFEIMFGEPPRWDHRDLIRDSVDSDVAFFMHCWAERFLASDATVDVLGKRIPDVYLFEDWELLLRANRDVLKHFLLSRTGEESLRFNDVSTQAFLAAYWATNYVHDEATRQRLWSCVPDDWLGKRQAYAEFWGFLADMPVSAYHRHRELKPAAKDCWEELFVPLFDQNHPYAPRDAYGQPIRASRLIYHAWERMQDTAAGKKFRGEFAAIRAGVQGAQSKAVAEALLEGFRWDMPLCEGKHGSSDTGEFVMGAWDIFSGGQHHNPKHRVKLSKFWMHRFCVCNDAYELFESRRATHREFANEVSADELSDHPIVGVSWYDSAVFAFWLGELTLQDGSTVRVVLPSEAQWEYSRLGVDQTVFFSSDGSRYGYRIEGAGGNFRLSYPWFSGRDDHKDISYGDPIGRRIRLLELLPDGKTMAIYRWGGPMDDNVWEWCGDWYGARTHHEKFATVKVDSRGRSWATGCVLRGGSWDDYGLSRQAAHRYVGAPVERSSHFGFRLAAVPVSPAEQSVG